MHQLHRENQVCFINNISCFTKQCLLCTNCTPGITHWRIHELKKYEKKYQNKIFLALIF